MTKSELNEVWNYYLSIENDLSKTSQYVEPMGQENVYSFEFARILVLACTEVESVFKQICFEKTGNEPKNDIGSYKAIILKNFPKITQAEVTITRLNKSIRPFGEWKKSLAWWTAYNNVKHYRIKCFEEATYMNAATAVAALYVIIIYLAEMNGLAVNNHESKYITSEYGYAHLLCKAGDGLPDFKKD